MNLYEIANFLSVSVSATRIMFEFRTNETYSRATLTIFGTAFVLVHVLSAIFFRQQALAWVIFSHSCVFALKGLPFFETWRTNRLWHQELSEFLDSIILEMRSGKGFRASMVATLTELEPRCVVLKPWILQAISSFKMSKEPWRSSTNPRFRQLNRELEHIERHMHHSLDRILAWRRRVRIEMDFRRRSGQVVTQIRMQALMAGILYVGVSLFSYKTILESESFGLFFASAGLFGAGLFCIFHFGGHIKWNF